jgi:hypothetical protein
MFDNLLAVGSTRADRELSRLRMAYTAAALDLARAMRAFHDAGVPLAPRTGAELEPWTAEQVRAVVGAASAWHRLVVTRREYDRSLPEVRRYLGRLPRAPHPRTPGT